MKIIAYASCVFTADQLVPAYRGIGQGPQQRWCYDMAGHETCHQLD